jgi:hypothetical protein
LEDQLQKDKSFLLSRLEHNKKGDYDKMMQDVNSSFQLKNDLDETKNELLKVTARLEASHKEM